MKRMSVYTPRSRSSGTTLRSTSAVTSALPIAGQRLHPPTAVRGVRLQKSNRTDRISGQACRPKRPKRLKSQAERSHQC